jgi:hypothetical protein
MVETIERDPFMNPAMQVEFDLLTQKVEVEQSQAEQADIDQWEQEMEIDPGDFLDLLPYEGFPTSEKLEQTKQQILATGFSVEMFRKLSLKANEKGTEDYLGSWGIGSDNYGEFSTYELLDKQYPEQRLSTIYHEISHANSPLVSEFSRKCERPTQPT